MLPQDGSVAAGQMLKLKGNLFNSAI